jgi:hypothetical protein
VKVRWAAWALSSFAATTIYLVVTSTQLMIVTARRNPVGSRHPEHSV